MAYHAICRSVWKYLNAHANWKKIWLAQDTVAFKSVGLRLMDQRCPLSPLKVK
jgi:hypothetical protein